MSKMQTNQSKPLIKKGIKRGASNNYTGNNSSTNSSYNNDFKMVEKGRNAYYDDEYEFANNDNNNNYRKRVKLDNTSIKSISNHNNAAYLASFSNTSSSSSSSSSSIANNADKSVILEFNKEEDYTQNPNGWNDDDKTFIQLYEPPVFPEVDENVLRLTSKKKMPAPKPARVPKTCPFYKKIPGTKFSVDAFNYGEIPGIDVYFLSHFHSDHYIGLTKKFNKTLICDNGTGNLVQMKLGINESCIRKLQLNKIYIIQGAEVVLITANHCPGSVVFIFRLPNGEIIVHTGDFRYTPNMMKSPFLKQLSTVHALYLDTTYLDPKYNFPSQKDSISKVVEVVKRHVDYRPKTLIVCGAYCIGKERVFFTLAEALGTKVFCVPDKTKMLQALENKKFNEYMVDTETDASIHVLPMRNLHKQCLTEYLAHRSKLYTNLIAIKPSGWEFSSAGDGFSVKTFEKDKVTLIGIPYSEHSSFSELRDFIIALKPLKVQPTVNVGSEPKRNMMMSWIDKWMLKWKSDNEF